MNIPFDIRDNAKDVAMDCIHDAIRDLRADVGDDDFIADYDFDAVAEMACEYANERCDVIYYHEAWQMVSASPDYYDNVCAEWFGTGWLRQNTAEDINTLMCHMASLGFLSAVNDYIFSHVAEATATAIDAI